MAKNDASNILSRWRGADGTLAVSSTGRRRWCVHVCGGAVRKLKRLTLFCSPWLSYNIATTPWRRRLAPLGSAGSVRIFPAPPTLVLPRSCHRFSPIWSPAVSGRDHMLVEKKKSGACVCVSVRVAFSFLHTASSFLPGIPPLQHRRVCFPQQTPLQEVQSKDLVTSARQTSTLPPFRARSIIPLLVLFGWVTTVRRSWPELSDSCFVFFLCRKCLFSHRVITVISIIVATTGFQQAWKHELFPQRTSTGRKTWILIACVTWFFFFSCSLILS